MARNGLLFRLDFLHLPSYKGHFVIGKLRDSAVVAKRKAPEWSENYRQMTIYFLGGGGGGLGERTA